MIRFWIQLHKKRANSGGLPIDPHVGQSILVRADDSTIWTPALPTTPATLPLTLIDSYFIFYFNFIFITIVRKSRNNSLDNLEIFLSVVVEGVINNIQKKLSVLIE